MKLKKGWKQIVLVSLITSLAVSYIISGFLVRIKNGFEIDMLDVLLKPSYIYDQVMADENLKMIILFIPFICLAIVLYLLRKNIIDTEYESASDFGIKGTAEWGNPLNYVDDKIFSKQNNFYKNNLAKSMNMDEGVIVGKIPGKNQTLLMTSDTDLDTRNVLVHAPTGGGKGQAYVITNLINIKNDNLIVIDPKGENYELTSQLKRDQGYKVYNIDFVNLDQERYNPLDYVNDDEDANNIANIIAMNSSDSDGGGGDFFTSRAAKLLAALISYVKAIYPKEQANMEAVIDVYNKYVAEEETCRTWLKKIPDDNPAKSSLLSVLQSLTTDTRASVMGNFDDIIATFVQERVKEMTKVSDFDFRDFQKQKSVLYVKIKIPYNDKQALTSMFFSQMIDTFFSLGEEQKDTTRLPIPVHFMLDEFANIGKIPNYDKTLAFCRGYNIFMHTIIQDVSQIQEDNMYGKEKTKTIIANHSAKLLLKVGEQENAKYWQEHLGNKTAKYKSESTSVSKQGKSTSISDVFEEVPLMPVNELLEMDEQKAVLILTGYKPLFIDKAWQFQVFKGLLTDSNKKYCYEKSRELLGYETPVHRDEQQVATNKYMFEEFQNQKTVEELQGHLKADINLTLSSEAKQEFHEKKEQLKQYEESQTEDDELSFEQIKQNSEQDKENYNEALALIGDAYTSNLNRQSSNEKTAEDLLGNL